VHGAMCIVVDTNVLAVTEGLHEGASDECGLRCVQLVRRIQAGLPLGVDSADAILQEYIGTLRGGAGGGLRTKLVQVLWRTRYDRTVCHQVEITPIAEPPGSFEEVPEGLRDFDLDDQKFLAVAVAEVCTPQLFQALDDEWWQRRVDFVASGLDVQFLCVAEQL